MIVEDKNKDFIIRLLILPSFKLVRHLILFSLIFLIAAGLFAFIDLRGDFQNLFLKYGIFLYMIIIILAGCYINIYILTPRFLLKNRSVPYALGLGGITVITWVSMISFQAAFIHAEYEVTDYTVIVINVLSSTMTFFFLFLGTSTIVLFKHWILDMQQVEELESATLQLELKMLENQINPHFLFNMLNNANIMIKKDADAAANIIGKLEDMLRYQINESFGERISLRKEIAFLNDFLELEKTRREFFSYTITESGDLDDIQMPPLLFITFVENAVKHNQDAKIASYVKLMFERTGKKFIFICENSIPQIPSKKAVGGIGLVNIKRRLDLLYKDNYILENIKTDINYIIKLELKL